MKKTEKRNTYIFIAVIIFALGIILAGILNTQRSIFPSIFMSRKASIEIRDALPNSMVLVDTKQVGIIKMDGTALFTGIQPGERRIIVVATSSWPWVTTAQAQSGKRILLNPLQVPKKPQQISLRVHTPLRIQAEKEIAKTREPTSITPLTRNGISVWVRGTTIRMRDTRNQNRVVFTLKTPIRSIGWYRNRSDALLVASKDTVFVLGLHNRTKPNYFPIYTGVAPTAVVNPTQKNELFIKDQEKYFFIEM